MSKGKQGVAIGSRILRKMRVSKFANSLQSLGGFQSTFSLYPASILAASIALLILVSCSFSNTSVLPNVVTPILADNNIITVHYNERPPYLVTTPSGVTGLTGSPATLAFEKANVPFRWQQTPSKRQIYILQQNRGKDCLIGWFKNPERENFAKYTLPIYQDLPQVALARANNIKINSVNTVDEIFSNPDITLLVKDGYSYGNFLDNKIAVYKPTKMVTTTENSGMLKMVQAGRADYFFIAPEEAAGVIKASEFSMDDFKIIQFLDLPAGEKRYILCSFQVEDTIIERLDAAIRQYVKNVPEF